LLDYDETRQEPPMVHERNHDQENELHRVRKKKKWIIERIISQRSMSMCTTVVRQNRANPLMAEFLHTRRVGLEMLDEIEEMRQDVTKGAFELPVKFRDDPDLTSNMMRARSMEKERVFRDKERNKLVKWLSYSDDFEKIYEDEDFATIKEKAKARQAMKDLENAGNPEVAKQVAAKRKAEEEALRKARTGTAALAREAKAKWAKVQERMAATAERKLDRRSAKLAEIALLARQAEEASSSEESSGEEGSEEESSGDEASGEEESGSGGEGSEAEDGAEDDDLEEEDFADFEEAPEEPASPGAPPIVDD
jgi:hypothetical protein